MPKAKTKYNRIKEVLTEKGLSQAWLADELDKTYPIINGYVNNHTQPSIPVLYKIAELLEVDPRDLLVPPKK